MKLNHAARFEVMRDDTAVLQAEQFAKWTLAQLMVDLQMVSASTTRTVVERDYQSMGALLVNHLASKLSGLLFPTQRPFFKIDLSDELQAEATRAGVSKQESDSELARLEMQACQRLFINASFNQLTLALKHLIVTGNVLIYRDADTRRSITYGLNQFTCMRDARGVLLDCVLREYTYFQALDSDIQRQLAATDARWRNAHKMPLTACRVPLYTRIWRDVSRRGKPVYRTSQEVGIVPVGKPGTYPEHLCPWQAPTWNLIAGEHYGRGMVEDYSGDFATLSDLSQAATLYGIEAARIINLVAPGAGAQANDLATAESGEWRQGDPSMIQAFESGSYQKMEQMEARIQNVFSRLSRAFMYSANTRDAERVTAYELKLLAQEVDNALGGVYSALAETLQVPLAHILLTEVKPEALSGIVTNSINLNIQAGIPALGRAADVANLMTAAQEAQLIVPILPVLDKRVDGSKLLDKIYSGQAIDVSSILKSPEQQAAEAQADAQLTQASGAVSQAAGLADQQEALANLQSGL